MTRALRPDALLTILGVLGWTVFAYVTVYAIATGWELTSGGVRQVDWHVFVAGARELLARRLYLDPLDTTRGVLSTPVYNLPPFSAVWAIPLLSLPTDVGGAIWQLLSGAAVALSAVMGALIGRVGRPLVVAGAFLGPLSISIVYLEGLHLATNNYLMLALIASFAWLFLSGRDAFAGLVLGVAIATKGWPIALLVPVIRERRWIVLAWSLGVAGVQTVTFLVWLGPGFPAHLLDAMRVAIPPTGLLIGPTSVDGLREVWNSGLGLVVAVILLALPLKGRSGIATAILAGLSPIANLWIHYGPTLLLAVVLVAADGIGPITLAVRRSGRLTGHAARG